MTSPDSIKHTAGPWRVEEGTTLIWGACDPDDTTDYGMGYPIIECRITPISYGWAKGPNADEGEANARLVAAAPELLEAIKAILANDGGTGSECFDARDLYEARQKSFAAIAKAEGRIHQSATAKEVA